MIDRVRRALRGEYGRSDADIAISVLKATFSAVPGVGNAIASLIDDYIPSETERVVRRTVGELRDRIRRLEDRIDVQQVDKDEFSELFKSCYLQIVRTHHQARLEAIVGIMVNLLLKGDDRDKLSFTELDHFSRCLDSLSLGAIHILALIASLDDQWGGREGGDRMSFSHTAELAPEFDESLLRGLLVELNGTSLVSFPALPAVRTSELAQQPLELTPLGRRFVDHILRDVS